MFVFRGKRGDLIKLLWWDGDGLCLLAKRLERGVGFTDIVSTQGPQVRYGGWVKQDLRRARFV